MTTSNCSYCGKLSHASGTIICDLKHEYPLPYSASFDNTLTNRNTEPFKIITESDTEINYDYSYKKMFSPIMEKRKVVLKQSVEKTKTKQKRIIGIGKPQQKKEDKNRIAFSNSYFGKRI